MQKAAFKKNSLLTGFSVIILLLSVAVLINVDSTATADTDPETIEISPVSGYAGTRVKITGSGFNQDSIVKFGETKVLVYEEKSSNRLVVLAPEQAQSDVTITVYTGNVTAKSNLNFRYSSLPTATPAIIKDPTTASSTPVTTGITATSPVITAPTGMVSTPTDDFSPTPVITATAPIVTSTVSIPPTVIPETISNITTPITTTTTPFITGTVAVTTAAPVNTITATPIKSQSPIINSLTPTATSASITPTITSQIVAKPGITPTPLPVITTNISVPTIGVSTTPINTPVTPVVTVSPVVPSPTITIQRSVPDSGITSGGTFVTITGSGFQGVVAVQFDGINASSFKILNDSSIIAKTPPHAIGLVNITVLKVNESGVLYNAYNYYEGILSAVLQSPQFKYTGTLNGQNLTLRSVMNILVTDTTEKGAGWQLVLGSNPIKAGAKAIPPVLHTIQNINITTINGIAPLNTFSYPRKFPTDIETIFKARPGTGIGQSLLTINTQLIIPASTLLGKYSLTINYKVVPGA